MYNLENKAHVLTIEPKNDGQRKNIGGIRPHDGTQITKLQYIRAIELTPQNECEQLSLFTDFARREKLMRLQDAIESIRGRFGNHAIYNAILMGDKKMPSDRRDN